MKGVSFQPINRPNSQNPDLALWDRWLDVESPSLRLALKGGVPNVVGKATRCVVLLQPSQDSKHPKHY